MKVTNQYGLPQILVRALSVDRYDPGESDISITSLIAPPQIRVLSKAHAGEIVEDVSDRIWRALGSATHYFIENATTDKDIVEKRFYRDVEGVKVGGQIDHYCDGILTDWKVTSAWAVLKGLKPEWEAQVNLQALLMEHNGYPVTQGQIVAILRDWSKNKVGGDYPESQAIAISVPLWDKDKQITYMEERVLLHQDAEKGFIAECTPEERWNEGDKYALKKEKNKTAKRVMDNEDDLYQYAIDNGLAVGTIESPILEKGWIVEVRPGIDKRCKDYCQVSEWCPQYQRNMAKL